MTNKEVGVFMLVTLFILSLLPTDLQDQVLPHIPFNPSKKSTMGIVPGGTQDKTLLSLEPHNSKHTRSCLNTSKAIPQDYYLSGQPSFQKSLKQSLNFIIYSYTMDPPPPPPPHLLNCMLRDSQHLGQFIMIKELTELINSPVSQNISSHN